MQVAGFFESLGQAFGAVVKFIVDSLGNVFDLFGGAISGFINGMSKTLGITPSFLSILVLGIGLLMLYAAVRAFMRGGIIAGLVWTFFSLWLLSGLIT